LQIISQKQILKLLAKTSFFRKKIRFLPKISSEVHIMQTKHFISPSVTIFRVIGHKNSQNTHIEKNGFLVKINTVVAKGLIEGDMTNVRTH
jgi:hypothetical protein